MQSITKSTPNRTYIDRRTGLCVSNCPAIYQKVDNVFQNCSWWWPSAACSFKSRDDVERIVNRQDLQDADRRNIGNAALNLTPEMLSKVPSEWGPSRPDRDKVGTRWSDPADEGSGIRIDEGNPNLRYPSQQVDHVRVNYKGNVIGRQGQILDSAKGDINGPEAHIPLEEWRTWRTWHQP